MTALKNDPEQFKRLVTPIGFYLTFMEGESRTKALEMKKFTFNNNHKVKLRQANNPSDI